MPDDVIDRIGQLAKQVISDPKGQNAFNIQGMLHVPRLLGGYVGSALDQYPRKRKRKKKKPMPIALDVNKVELLQKAFEESKHPRDNKGRFASRGGGVAAEVASHLVTRAVVGAATGETEKTSTRSFGPDIDPEEYEKTVAEWQKAFAPKGASEVALSLVSDLAMVGMEIAGAKILGIAYHLAKDNMDGLGRQLANAVVSMAAGRTTKALRPHFDKYYGGLMTFLHGIATKGLAWAHRKFTGKVPTLWGHD
jgi:hypothetical protein